MIRYCLCLLLPLLLWSCQPTEKPATESSKFITERFTGETMGTTFEITFLDSTGIDLMRPIQQLLIDINNAVSTYVDTSNISSFNQTDSLIVDNTGHFHRNYINAQKIYTQTKGWFNPTVMPLVNYWGFGYTEKKMITKVDSSKIDSLLSLVDFEAITNRTVNDKTTYYKPASNTGIQLDFSAIAKGDAVDEIGRLLETNGIQNYFVEIGGEIRTRGTTSSGFAWRTGIRQPQEKSNQNNLQMIVELKDKALATSGNYENYHEDPSTGQKYAHTINPRTGYPERNNLLSASVLTNECGTADAFATAFMAMGLEAAWEIANTDPAVEAYFIYADEQGNIKEKMTKGILAIKVD